MRPRREPRRPRASGIVTLLTDFGVEDPYVGIVKGVILAVNPAARIVDLTHAIPPQDIRRGALALEASYRVFPAGTVHLAVVDPGVGGPRRPLAVHADGHVFVGPAQRQVQESQRIEDGLRRVPERFDQRLDGGLGGLRAIRVATHAIDDDEQSRMLGDRNRHAILVVGAIAQQADFGVFDAQGGMRGLINCRALYRTPRPAEELQSAP